MTEIMLDRRELLPKLIPRPAEYLIISGLAGASRHQTEDDLNRILLAAAQARFTLCTFGASSMKSIT